MCENRAKCEGAREHASAPKALERAERPGALRAIFAHSAPEPVQPGGSAGVSFSAENRRCAQNAPNPT